MNYKQIEDEIVARLNSFPQVTNVADCRRFPETPAEDSEPYEKALVNVIFENDKFSGNKSVSEVSQDNGAVFAISIKSRFRSNEDGIGTYDVFGVIADAITGFRPTGCKAITIGTFGFQGYEKNIWEYILTINCPSTRSQVFANNLPGHYVPGVEEDVFYKPKD